MSVAGRKTAFVTGGTGFLGLNLIEQLAEAGWAVTALHRPGSDLSGLKKFDVTPAKGQLIELDALTDVVPEDLDAVFHVAGDTTMWSRHFAPQLRTNVDGTRNMVTAAHRRGARRFVHTSSIAAYGVWHGREPISEDSEKKGDLSAVNYDRTKYHAEVVIQGALRNGVDAVVLNPCHIIGRYDAHNWGRMIRMINEGTLPGVPPRAGTFCHAEAVAKAHIAAAERGRTGENYLLGGPVADFLEVAQVIGRLTGKKVPRRPVPAWLFMLVARAKTGWGNLRDREPDLTPQAAEVVLANARIDTDKAERELGYVSPDLEAMLRDCYDWMKREKLV
ncbi:MAG: NAD-dependent epimerase/dehydratase family protein [Bauldia litoralis]